jgi:imidazole glycerol-phosphate synthase subunit HisF
MPCLLLKESRLVKTVKFKNPDYVGDPVNAVKIYNEKEVDELIFLDISATVNGRKPSFKTIYEIATECFMPFTYGGGINNLDDMKKIFTLGVEKVAINTYAFENPDFIAKAAEMFGSQSIVVSMDAKKRPTGGYEVYTQGGRRATKTDPATYAVLMEKMGAGELLLTSIDMDGTLEGFDLDLIRLVSQEISIPLIACGGAGSVEDFAKAVNAGASAVAAGSMVVYQGKNRGVLINFPSQEDLRAALP